jgi:hypothetical protein
MARLEARFVKARDSTLANPQEANDGTPDWYNNLALLVEIFHAAGLAYSFQVLLDTSQARAAAAVHIRRAIELIGQLFAKTEYVHDLVWRKLSPGCFESNRCHCMLLRFRD